jgi:hypothetical protein
MMDTAHREIVIRMVLPASLGLPMPSEARPYTFEQRVGRLLYEIWPVRAQEVECDIEFIEDETPETMLDGCHELDCLSCEEVTLCPRD